MALSDAPQPNRRQFIRATAATAAAVAGASSIQAAPLGEWSDPSRLPIFLSVKIGMVQVPGTLVDKFNALKEIGYDGIELNSPGGLNKQEAIEASRQVGLPIHGVVDSIHWNVRLSDPDPKVRERGLQGLLKAIKDTRYIGGSAVLLVPGKVTNSQNENQDQVWERSIEQIRKAIPYAAKVGVRILIENVWNGFCYVHDGPDNQSADQLAAYIDEIASPWVGSYFDIGNHRKYAKPEEWIRTLGPRIVKVDVKDWSRQRGWVKIGEGDIDWSAIRDALREIGYAGWATAEVSGGGYDRLKEIHERMLKVFDL